ncbi:NUDIX domain-containing protein [Actinomadura kijaniata]|uniref:NUDIX domain-containing protein n=1 Tax=Actinomadura kijaniata TaxID=46161 RepID=UPI00082C8E0D|nr:NUDIX domain-containing protein [Actinomadura kijaniata]
MTKTCDNASVGVLIEDGQGRLLLLTRATPPVGIAPCAGHVFDEHTVTGPDGRVNVVASYRAAAAAEVAEELGLTVVGHLELVTFGWRTAACRRIPGPGGPGHHWHVYRAQVTGELAPSTRETRGAEFYDRDALQALAARTIAYAWDQVSIQEFEADPGLEPVWVRWLVEAGWITVSDGDLWQIDHMLTLRARRGVTDGRIPLTIQHRTPDGGTQTLWAEADDLDHLARLQELTTDPHRADEVIPLYARLHPEGTDYPRAFRAGRITLTEIERPLPDHDAPAHPDALAVLPLNCQTCGEPLMQRHRDGRPFSSYCSTRCSAAAAESARPGSTAAHP